MRRLLGSQAARRALPIALALGFTGIAVLIARDAAGGGQRAGATVRLLDGVPLGVSDSRTGVLAAAGNYLTLGSSEIEQQPARFAVLVTHAYLPSVRAQTLTQARELRQRDLLNMRNYREGGHAIALLAAQRIVRYTPASAAIESWLGGIVWGPRLAPRQTWSLVDSTLAWRHGRWLIASSQTSTQPAPTPAVVYVQGEDDRAGAFSALAGMSSPLYGATER